MNGLMLSHTVRHAIACCVAALAIATTASAARAQAAPPAPPVTAGDKTYRLFADVVTSGQGAPGIQGALCVTQTVFFPGDVIVFRAVIADGATGTVLTSADVQSRGIKAVVTLSDGTSVPLRLGSHPPAPAAPAHSTYWAGADKTTPDHPTGTLKWTLTVTDAAGNTTKFAPMGQDNGETVLTLAQKAPAK